MCIRDRDLASRAGPRPGLRGGRPRRFRWRDVRHCAARGLRPCDRRSAAFQCRPLATGGGSSSDGGGAQADSGPSAEYAALEPGPPLGISGTRPIQQIVLHEGDALVAFTGGLLERHERSLAQGQSTLLQSLGTMSATAARSISQHVIDTLIGDTGLENDCALLVVVRDSRVHQMASVLVPPHTIAVRGARRWARA